MALAISLSAYAQGDIKPAPMPLLTAECMTGEDEGYALFRVRNAGYDMTEPVSWRIVVDKVTVSFGTFMLARGEVQEWAWVSDSEPVRFEHDAYGWTIPTSLSTVCGYGTVPPKPTPRVVPTPAGVWRWLPFVGR